MIVQDTLSQYLNLLITNGSDNVAKFEIRGLEEYELKLSRLESGTDEIAQKAIEKGAGIVADGMRSSLQKVISGKSTGDMEKSFGITPVKRDSEGILNARVGFHGYDKKGVANQLKARVLNSRKPFARRAIRSTKQPAEKAMADVIDKEIQKIMK